MESLGPSHSDDEGSCDAGSYLLALLPIVETKADPNFYGFRPKRSTADAIEQCFLALAKETSPEWAESRHQGRFDNISHDWMLAHIPMDAGILKKWLKARYVDNRTQFPTSAGTPQAGLFPQTLANLTLDGLQRVLKDRFPVRQIRKALHNSKVHLVRYADDFIITGADISLSPRGIAHSKDFAAS